MNINSKQIQRLKQYIKNVDTLIKNDDVQELLDAVDDIIVDNILGNNNEPDEEGIELQKIYDEIYNQN